MYIRARARFTGLYLPNKSSWAEAHQARDLSLTWKQHQRKQGAERQLAVLRVCTLTRAPPHPTLPRWSAPFPRTPPVGAAPKHTLLMLSPSMLSNSSNPAPLVGLGVTSKPRRLSPSDWGAEPNVNPGPPGLQLQLALAPPSSCPSIGHRPDISHRWQAWRQSQVTGLTSVTGHRPDVSHRSQAWHQSQVTGLTSVTGHRPDIGHRSKAWHQPQVKGLTSATGHRPDISHRSQAWRQSQVTGLTSVTGHRPDVSHRSQAWHRSSPASPGQWPSTYLAAAPMLWAPLATSPPYLASAPLL